MIGPTVAPRCSMSHVRITPPCVTTSAVPLVPATTRFSARVIRASYDLLGYISFFTVGEDENRAWSIPRHTTAQVAASEIHSDIARGFIRAEVVSYDHLMARGTMAGCRDHGEVRLEGKEYIVEDGDIINFRFAT